MKKHYTTHGDRLTADTGTFQLKYNAHIYIKLIAAQFLWHWDEPPRSDQYKLQHPTETCMMSIT